MKIYVSQEYKVMFMTMISIIYTRWTNEYTSLHAHEFCFLNLKLLKSQVMIDLNCIIIPELLGLIQKYVTQCIMLLMGTASKFALS